MSQVRLNKAQREAVEHDLGPMLVLAGAGSGKTGVVTQRLARLIERGVPSRALLAMTFTNKAAGEMQERVTRLVGKKAAADLLVCTFHRFGLEVLTRETKALGFRGRFAIFDRGDCSGVVRDLLRNVVGERTYDVGAILARISLAKNAFLDPEAYDAAVKRASVVDEYDEITAMIYPQYIERLASLQGFDFDDLVCEPVHLWRRRPDILQRYRERFRYLIVDEYQDTNPAQLELLRQLSAEHKNLCVVGDDAQAIYAWRGADVRNILEFDQQFPGTRVVRLESNYRSRRPILDLANALLDKSPARRHEKRLVCTRGEGELPQLVVTRDGATEAMFVAEEIQGLLQRGTRGREIAVLYRSNLQAPEIESELKARGIAYQLFGGTQIFERKEVKDVIAYLTAALDPAHELAVRRIVNYPARGVGDAAVRRLATHATAQGRTLLEAVQRAHEIDGLPPAAREGCRELARIVAELQRQISEGMASAELLRGLIQRIDLKRNIEAEAGANNKAAARRWANLRYLIAAFERRDAARQVAGRNGPAGDGKAARDLAQFLRMLLLREDAQDDDGDAEKVTLTTMHGSKGLEFDHVFVVGVEEGLIPHRRTTAERATDPTPIDGRVVDEIEQERRLLYVAITRAKVQLYLTRAEGRLARAKLVKRVPSRFLLELPPELMQERTMMAPPAPDPRRVQRGAQDVLAAILAAGKAS